MSSACTSCEKSPPEVTLRKCAKCSTTPYCSKECQKADWKKHKKLCGQFKDGTFITEDLAGKQLSPPKGVEKGVTMHFTRLDKGTWLHDRSEEDVYRLLIDAYRLRVEDMYNIEGEVDEDILYSGNSDGLRGFQRFLGTGQSRRGLLPPWWNDSKREECEDFGMDPDKGHCLRHAVEKSDIIEHYGDSWFPMQLRMFVEAAYGRVPGGSDGKAMRQMMMAMEQGTAGLDAMMMNMSAR